MSSKITKYSANLWKVVFLLLIFPLHKIGAESVNETITLKNPLGSTNSIPDLITKILNDIITPIGSVIIVFFIIYAGFLFVKAQGNEKELEEAKNILKYVVIGAAVILGANLIAAVISGTINNLK